MSLRTPRRSALLSLALITSMLTGCGTPATAQTDAPTPTPLPPAADVARPTFTVKRGTIENPLEVGGRVSPVNLKQLAFQRAGTVAVVNADRGAKVTAGQVLAQLQQDDELDELRQAQDSIVQAKRDLASAELARTKRVEQAKLDLQDAQDGLALVLPGGSDDPIRKAQKDLETAERAANDQSATGSEGKTGAEYDLLKATEALSDTQKTVSAAYWANNWAQKYGTNPDQPYIETTDGNGKVIRKPNKLTDKEIQAYQDKYVEAQRQLREAERAIVTAQRTLDKARDGEISGNNDANDKVREAERVLNEMISGKGNKELIAAQKAVKSAKLALEEARAETLNTAQKAVEDAQRRLDRAKKKVSDGQIIAPQDGEIISSSIAVGDTAEANGSVIELADTTQLEIGAELSADQMRVLQEGQPAEITLLSRPDVAMPAIIRQLPEPYGSGGSGTVASKDRRTLFEITDFKGQDLKSGQNVKIRIIIERKEQALWLPPEALRAFEGRRFVLVRTGAGELRQTVRVGIETDDKVEILEGVNAGDVIVGQ